MDLSPLLLDLGDCDDQNAILHLGGNGIAVNLIPVGASRGRQCDVTLKHTNLSLGCGQSAEELLISGTMNDAGNVQDAALAIPVDADVFLLGSGEGYVEDVGPLGTEDVDGWGEGGVVVVGGGGVLESLGLVTKVLEEGVVGAAA